MKITKIACLAAIAVLPMSAQSTKVDPSRMPRAGQVDERFQSYNVEMVEVTGGRFWAPYKSAPAAAAKPPANTGIPGIDPNLFRYRPPLDLSNSRLRKLAAALGPAYVRVSGTWANSTFFHDSDAPAPSTPPAGFGGVLTRAQWRGVVEFAKATDSKIVTSFAVGAGVRDANGLWTPAEARKFLAYTASVGGSIAAAEFFNEPTFAGMGGAPKGYDAASYGRDMKVFLPFVRKAAPQMKVIGPGSIGETGGLAPFSLIKSEDMLRESGTGLDGFSYHFYPAVSKRCAAMGASGQTSLEDALTEDWLSRTDRDAAFYIALRDRFEPGKPMWLTETAGAACGGNPWVSTFVDSFRYLDQLGRLAKRGVQVVAHNTLAASDYGLIDEETLTPRPDYWAALLWKRLMGTTVLDAGNSGDPKLHLYAHCMANRPGGVTVLAINTDKTAAHSLTLPGGAERYSLASTKGLEAATVELNGKELALGKGDSIPAIRGVRVKAGELSLAPATITFVTFPSAANESCR